MISFILFFILKDDRRMKHQVATDAKNNCTEQEKTRLDETGAPCDDQQQVNETDHDPIKQVYFYSTILDLQIFTQDQVLEG